MSFVSPCKIFSYAKINLFLHVIGKREDGFHLIDSVVCFLVNLYDEIIITKCDENTQVLFDTNSVDANDNSILTVIKYVEDLLNINIKLNIKIKKNIPIGSGMGGGSSNAASLLCYLSELYKIEDDLMYKIARNIGSDVSCCIKYKSCRLSGTGTTLHEIKSDFSNFYIVAVYPNVNLSSAMIYKSLEFDPDKLIDNIYVDDRFRMSRLVNYSNDLQLCTMKKIDEVSLLIKFMTNIDNAVFTRMTGSGSTCFAVFKNLKDAKYASNIINKEFPNYKLFLSSIL